MRKHRFAVMEGGISLVATLLPAIEPIQYTTIVPSSRSPVGRTVLEVSHGGGGRGGRGAGWVQLLEASGWVG